MTKKELLVLIDEAKRIFDIVRLVDVAGCIEYSVNEEGMLVKQPYPCYQIWKKDKRCDNCTSAKAYCGKTRRKKVDFLGDEVYDVTSLYIEVDEVPYVLEAVSRLQDDILLGVYGKEGFMDAIKEYNKSLYIDSLTGAYNRQYYNEQLSELPNPDALAMVDVDNFKEVNGSFGREAGDEVLRELMKIFLSNVRTSDAVIRYGGDEFILIFRDIPKDTFADRLEKIRQDAEKTEIFGFPDVKITISIGGVYSNDSSVASARRADELLYKAKKTRNTICID